MTFGDWCECFFSVRFLKWLVFVLNLIFSLAGAGLLGVSVWLLRFNQISVFLVESTPADYSRFNILIASGVVMIIVGVIGSYGAYRESKCLLGMASVFYIIILGVEIGGGVWAHNSNNRAEMSELIQKKVQDIVYQDYGQDEVMTKTLDTIQQSILGYDNTDGVWSTKNRTENYTLHQEQVRDVFRRDYVKNVVLAQPFDGIQQSLKCCGSDSFLSWAFSSYNLGSDNETVIDYKVPSSCCVNPFSSLCQTVRKTALLKFNSSTSGTVIYTDGCVPKLHALVGLYFENAIRAGVGIGMLALFTLIFTMLYCCAIRLHI